MEEILTPEAAASYLKIHYQTIRRYAREGTIPGFMLGGQWRFRKSALDQWSEEWAKNFKPKHPQKIPNSNKLILVVDDEQGVRFLLKTVFTDDMGYRTLCLTRGSEALPTIRQELPVMVFLDMIMPDMNGAEVFTAIRQEYPDLPVVFITGFGESEILAQALRVSPAMVLAKPVSVEHLKDAVKKYDPSYSAEVRKISTDQVS